MILIAEIKDNLQKILEENEPIKTGLIKSLQLKIWNDESITDESLNEIVTDLAYDLDFYEPNIEFRMEDNTFYGSDKLEEVLISALEKLGKLDRNY